MIKLRIIVQKSNIQNTNDFINDALNQSYIDSLGFNITYTLDNKIVIFNSNTLDIATTNTINHSTFEQLQNYEISLLTDMLGKINAHPIRKDIYINLIPSDPGIIDDSNIQSVTDQMNKYINNVKTIIEQYPSLNFNLHSANRSLVTLLKQEIKTARIGFVFTGNDLSFIDVSYYVLTPNSQNDAIIDTLLEANKEVIIYISSDYSMSYLYEHYLGEKSTPHLQEVISKLAFMTNYPEMTYQLFST